MNNETSNASKILKMRHTKRRQLPHSRATRITSIVFILAVLALTALALSGCGVTKRQFEHLKHRVDRTDERVYVLEQQFEQGVAVLNAMDAQIEALTALIEQNSANDAALEALVSQLNTSLVAVQNTQNNMAAEIAELQTYEHVVGFVDPCGDGPGFDEVLMQLSSGKLLAYFESGSKRFLSLIPAGNYMTTDQQGCHFSVDAAGNVHD